jgi:hypothetical protein
MKCISVALAAMIGVAFCSVAGCSRDTRLLTCTIPGGTVSDISAISSQFKRPTTKPQQTRPRDAPSP